MKPYIDFYKKHNICPTTQVCDTNHFRKREYLYRCLGLLPGYFKDKEVIEFGPGGGYNALYTNSLNPKKLMLVDGNLKSCEIVRSLLGKLKVVQYLIEDYKDSQYDIVICENTIPYQKNPSEFLKHVSSFVKPGGVLIITCEDSVSLFSEILRNLMGLILTNKEDSLESKLNILRPVFIPHLETLKDMTRPVEDWIIDQIIQPIGNLMSITEAISTLKDFKIYGSSPRFLTDWNWYKSVSGPDWFKLFLGNVDRFLDCRVNHAGGDNEIRLLCGEVFTIFKKYEATNYTCYLDEINKKLVSLTLYVDKRTALSISDFSNALSQYLDGEPFPKLKEFTSFFGRGTQYLSFTRNV